MSWKHWTTVAVVIGVGVVLQMPRGSENVEERSHVRPDTAVANAESADGAAGTVEQGSPYRTIALEVRGMT